MVEADMIRWRWSVLHGLPDDLVRCWMDYCLDVDMTSGSGIRKYEERVRLVEAHFCEFRIYQLETHKIYPLEFNLTEYTTWVRMHS